MWFLVATAAVVVIAGLWLRRRDDDQADLHGDDEVPPISGYPGHMQ